MVLLVLGIGYPFASELLQLDSIQESKKQFEKTVLGSASRSSNLRRNHRQWEDLPEDLKQDFRDLGFYPASLPPNQHKFELSTLQGDRRSLDDYRGNWIVLNFWATWCPPCRMEMPSLDQLQEAFRGKPLTVLTVNVQQKASTIRQFKRNYGFDLPILLDETGTVTTNYEARGLPETWIISPSNQPIAKLDGPLEWHSEPVVSALERLVNGSN
jgi:thiol-disulfide isomerase/thioredoxin